MRLLFLFDAWYLTKPYNYYLYSDESHLQSLISFNPCLTRALQVIVQKVSKRRKRSTSGFPTSIYDYKTSNCAELSECYYIAAELPNVDTDFVVGDGKMYAKYENVKLVPATTYNIYTRGVSYNNDEVGYC